MSRLVKIQVVSDTICPWCFVGKRRLEKAMAAAAKELRLQFEVTWEPFFLDPTLPKAGVNKLERYKSKFSEAQVARILPMMAEVGASLEPPVRFSYGGMMGATRDSHRLIEFARSKGGPAKQNELVECLFQAYFENEKSMGDDAVLLECAERVGLDRGEAEEALRTDAFGDEVDEAASRWTHEHGITGVPFFRIADGKYEASGARDEDYFAGVFRRIAAGMDAAAAKAAPKPGPATAAASAP
ncbi:hypothetical protein FNF27_00967 [Cafeteria roenbergensis]|uniref:DSBA-like thioredoxin domain-containing protein n=1 Tax=Cafeteria roenbergensis TaxID=33653 RepID=A0A5A8EIR8_CAFRO|nr:hypothetical protein FNF29_01213 [Cafeteria roenbergensis]KAA0177796.1 hypothetical protein FNF27_00967 [Cafeteria roenbergensis]|eukprot:KAA0156421.1 hypothetical protein FNF29_01213 [Cafeteria roenbergensis]